MADKKKRSGGSGPGDQKKKNQPEARRTDKKPGGRKETSFKKLLVSIVIGFVAIAFIGSFAYQQAAQRGGGGNHLAVVNGQPINAGGDSLFANYYRQFHEQQRQQLEEGEEISEQQNRQLLRQALDAVIQRTLILQYAEEKGVEVSRNAVLARIMREGYYASPEKSFNQERYTNTPEADRQRLFKSVREQMIVELFVDQFVTDAKVSDLDLRSFHRLSDYGKKIQYVFLRFDDVPEEELMAFYVENQMRFEQAHAAHILIKEDQEEAQAVYQRVMENPDQFAEIASEVSEDPTAEEGGDLGWFYREDMVPEFSQAALALSESEISGPVQTMFGYHIIKLLDPIRVQPFEDALYRVKQEYVEANREQVEKKVASRSKDFITRASRKPEEFIGIADAMDLDIETTDYIAAGGSYIMNEDRNVPLFELMGVQDLPETVFSTRVGAVGGPVRTPEGDLIFKVIEEKEFSDQEFDEAREYLTRVYTNLKGNYQFNDWYAHAVRTSRIENNFNELIQ
jgi:parvulin-like peptidyl-prolyl isomerase